MCAGRFVLLVFGIIFLVACVFLLLGGVGIVGAHAAMTDSDGFYTTESTRVRSDSYAMATESAELDWEGACRSGRRCDPGDLVTIKVEAESRDTSQGVFIGIGQESDVADYLDAHRWSR